MTREGRLIPAENGLSLSVNIVDPILLVLLSLFALRGYFRGLFREGFSLLGLFVGFMAAVRYAEPVAALGTDYWKFSPIILKAITFVVLLFVVYFTFSLGGWLLHRGSKFLFLQAVNRMGGVILGMGKGAAILALIIFVLSSYSWIPREARQKIDESYLGPPLYQFARVIIRSGKANLLPQDESRTNNRANVGFFGESG